MGILLSLVIILRVLYLILSTECLDEICSFLKEIFF